MNNDASGLTRQRRKARSTGVTVVLEDTRHPDSDLDPDGGRWATLCDDHGAVVNHDTLQLARWFAPWPEEWCQDCRDLLESGQKAH